MAIDTPNMTSPPSDPPQSIVKVVGASLVRHNARVLRSLHLRLGGGDRLSEAVLSAGGRL